MVQKLKDNLYDTCTSPLISMQGAKKVRLALNYCLPNVLVQKFFTSRKLIIPSLHITVLPTQVQVSHGKRRLTGT